MNRTRLFVTLALITGALIVVAVVMLTLYLVLGFPDAADHQGWVGLAFDLTASAAFLAQAGTVAAGAGLATQRRGLAVAAVIASLAGAAALLVVVVGRPAWDGLYGVVALAWLPVWIWTADFSRKAVAARSLPRWVAFPLTWLLTPLWLIGCAVSWRDGAVGTPPWQPLVLTTTTFAWMGFFVHNVADLPGQTIFSPESLYPTSFTTALLVVWLIPTTRVVGTWALLLWTALNLIGGVISVLPLPILPFAPDQSVEHYVFHVVYALTQLPITVVCIAWLRSRAVERRTSK